MTVLKLQGLDLETLLYSQYSPSLALTNFHISKFWHLFTRIFFIVNDLWLERWNNSLITAKETFTGVPARWQTFVNNIGQYFDENNKYLKNWKKFKVPNTNRSFYILCKHLMPSTHILIILLINFQEIFSLKSSYFHHY